jgi:cellulose synthase/poly-beta-1,6-N-acetylglucosamine synthase-like glycosyltransferase
MKKVSIIIPVYADEKYIAATVQSVLEQTYKNAAYLLYLLPQPLYSQIKILVSRIIGASQRRHILRDHSRQSAWSSHGVWVL